MSLPPAASRAVSLRAEFGGGSRDAWHFGTALADCIRLHAAHGMRGRHV
ncbi:hypothetical protein QFZ24_000049 [Streptomyces phaeochromogenes]|nr:hypothetical protein [Streptomyces phaeochromogenes]MDQ0946126.1 hypothetical protein [Streptomyces phaeochromogenes]